MDQTRPPIRVMISRAFCRQKKQVSIPPLYSHSNQNTDSDVIDSDHAAAVSSAVGLAPYLNPAPATRNPAPRSTKQFNQRVKKLEELVDVLGKLKNNHRPGAQSQQQPSITDDAIATSLGKIQVGEAGTSYVSGVHRAALQPSIAETRNPELLPGLCPPAGKEDFLAAVPFKVVADRLVSRRMLTEQFDRFWHQPQDVSLTWLSMLFSVMCLAIRLHQRSEGEAADGIDDPEEARTAFRLNAAYCLIKDRYTTPSKCTIEALLTLLFGIIFRLAMHVGLHRDRSRYRGISCCEIKMHRRIWAFMTQGNALSSFQSGLPCMMHKGLADTKLPRNLLDEDFDENTTTLPPARPDTDATPPSYVIAKSGIANAFAVMTDPVASAETSNYQSVIELDNQLISDSVIYSLEILFQKSRCIPHQQYLSEARLNPAHAKSRQSCIDAAMKLLHHQATLDAQVQPRGTLCHSKWFLSSLASHNLILAAMILCLEMHYQSRNDNSSRGEACTSPRIWSSYKESFVEAMQVWRFISIMLGKLNATSFNIIAPTNSGYDTASPTPNDQFISQDPASTSQKGIENTMDLEMDLSYDVMLDSNLWDFRIALIGSVLRIVDCSLR
ncbi:fungal specific transcription factor domain-containing protein [Aspergillus undulatus]|uniref:fungal specific transcription factor domain-containing protein n=1 Tax=Aspergillus undulatus TaxID=1810928 RepID=UPI003CCE0D03